MLETSISSIHILIAIILLAINLCAFVFVALDKNRSVDGNNRIPEVYFFVWAIFFGSLGILLGMLVFRHKIRKWYLALGTTLLVCEQALLIYLGLVRP